MASDLTVIRLVDPAEYSSGILLRLGVDREGGVGESIVVARDIRAAWGGVTGSVGVVGLAVPEPVIPVSSPQLEAAATAGPWTPDDPALVHDVVRAAVLRTEDAPLFGIEPLRATVIARVVRAIAGGAPETATVAAARVAQIASIVEQFSSDPRLTPEAIAGALGISRRTLYDLAAESLGGLSQYIRVARATAAAELISSVDADDRSLGRVAARVGFSSTRQLLRALDAAFGMTPQKLRETRTTARAD